jgi:hypothetical protein
VAERLACTEEERVRLPPSPSQRFTSSTSENQRSLIAGSRGREHAKRRRVAGSLLRSVGKRDVLDLVQPEPTDPLGLLLPALRVRARVLAPGETDDPELPRHGSPLGALLLRPALEVGQEPLKSLTRVDDVDERDGALARPKRSRSSSKPCTSPADRRPAGSRAGSAGSHPSETVVSLRHRSSPDSLRLRSVNGKHAPFVRPRSGFKSSRRLFHTPHDRRGPELLG